MNGWNNIQMIFDPTAGITLGCAETVNAVPYYLGDGTSSKLTFSLGWVKAGSQNVLMKTVVARGSPFVSMSYIFTTPRIISEKRLLFLLKDDSTELESRVNCSDGAALQVEKELMLAFAESDMTWMIFISKPSSFRCITSEKGFELQFVEPFTGMLRIALVSNCTTAVSPILSCADTFPLPRDNSDYIHLLRNFSSAPSESSYVDFDFPAELTGQDMAQAVNVSLTFKWDPVDLGGEVDESNQLIVFGLPHHIQRLQEPHGL